MNTHYTYFLILAASLCGPLALSFDRKVAFYKNWKYLSAAIFIPALLYISWDVYFTLNGIWSFNERYITGAKLLNLPVEEVLFFLVVPYCCIFIYECVRCYFPGIKNKKTADIFLQILAIILLVTGVFFYDRYYTCWTFIFCATFIGIIYAFRNFFQNFDAIYFLISFAVILIPFLIINGFLTGIPVVLYNNKENLGIRIYTIPFEDIFYGMLLTLMNIAIYEQVRNRIKA